MGGRTSHGIQGGRFAYEKIGISHLCARTPVFLHTFGDPPETLKNQYKSTLGVFLLNYAYKNGTNKLKSEPCSFHMEPVLDFGGRGVHHDSRGRKMGCMGILGGPRVHHDSPRGHELMTPIRSPGAVPGPPRGEGSVFLHLFGYIILYTFDLRAYYQSIQLVESFKTQSEK